MKPTTYLRRFLLLAGSSLLVVSSASADTIYWDGTTNSWNIAANWTTAAGAATPDPSAVPGALDDAVFNRTGQNGNITIRLDADQAAQSLTFASAGTTTIAGNTSGTTARQLTLGTGGITVNSGAGAANIGTTNNGVINIVLSGAQTWTNNSANTLSIGTAYNNSATSGNVDLGAHQLTIDGSGRTSIGVINQSEAVLTGSGALIKNGTGVFSLGGNNTGFSGDITVNGGIFYYGDNPGAMGTGNILITNGAVEGRWTSGITRNQGTGAGEIQITGGVSGFGGGNNATFNIGDVMWGSGTFNPTEFLLQTSFANSNGKSTFSSNIDLDGANRTIRSDQTGGDLVNGYGNFSGNITNGGTVAGLIKTGVGHHILSGTNTYDGGTTINQGSVLFDGIAAMPDSGNVQVNDGGTLGIQVGGGGNWTTGTSGVGTIGGILAGDGGAGTGTVGYSGNVGLQLDVVANSTYSGDIGNVGTSLALHKTGTSSLTLDGNNTYSGGTTLYQGNVIADSATALGSGDITFRGGTLQYTANSESADFGSQIANSTSAISINTDGQDVTLSDLGSGNTGGLTKSGAGTLTFTGTNSYSGATTLSAGTIAVNDGTLSTSGGAVSLASNTTVSVTGGIGVSSTWDLGNQDLQQSGSNVTDVQVTVDGGGVAGSAVLDNLKILTWGRTLTNSTMTITDGGQVNVTGEVRVGNPYYNSAGGANISIGGGTATSTFSGDGGDDFYIGFGERRGSNNNVVTVSSGGVLTNIRDMFVGHVNNVQNASTISPSTANQLTVTGTGTASMRSLSVGYAQNTGIVSQLADANANLVDVTSGGQLSTSGTSYIGRANASFSESNANTLTVSGTDSSWNAGNQNVFVGHTNNATAISNNNILTVGAGSELTNVKDLTVGFGSGTETGNQLVINGILTATTVTVSEGNSLSGSGTINGAVTVNGNLAPGSSPGQMTFNDSLALAATSNTVMELGGTTLGTGYDNITLDSLASALTYGGNLNVVNFGLYDMDLASFTYDLFTLNSVTPDADFDFASVTVNSIALTNTSGVWTGSNGDVSYSFDQSLGDLAVVVIPEPHTALLGAIGLLALLRRRR